jgi:hypothetical protein
VAAFDYDLDFKTLNFREHPELYRIGKGEQGVLLIEPYKSEILPHWRFKTPDIAEVSAKKIYEMFGAYLEAEDFPGADMARKFLQMGWTRAALRQSQGRQEVRRPRTGGEKGAERRARTRDVALSRGPGEGGCGGDFYEKYVQARQHPEYLKQRALHIECYETP